MTSRVPVGASNRTDLFGPGPGGARNSYNQDALESDEQDSSSNDPLQLEHMVGYAGDYRGTVSTLPQDENSFLQAYVFVSCL
jgi:hypothetical protein